MKKWSGGLLIIVLSMILVFIYNFMNLIQQPQNHQTKKQSAYEFFRNHPSNESRTDTDSGSPQEKVESFNRPGFVYVEGLEDLYARKDGVLGEESVLNSLRVWDRMRLLLSRSDSLPETGQGVKEASVAWKALLSLVEEDNAAKFNGKSVDSSCPYSVGNGTVDIMGISTGERTILGVPCGLIEDSSITIVAIPAGGNGSFKIELVGSGISGEAEPPILLQYYVSLPEENTTVEPFIIQNAWSSERGWGKEERCPARGNVNAHRVDGLVLCNEQAIRSTMHENINTSQPSPNSSANDSSLSAYSSSNFPFVEGNPFIATLWAGYEGFHMTVNGRHESSFVYREELEPWSVNGVKIGGGLNILSALAKGLPVSEDHDILVDVERLKAPPVARKRLVMLIGVFSTGNNFERRMALRRSWMQYEAVHSGNVAVRFFIGLHKNSQVNLELMKEAKAYGDIQFMPFVDYYSLISLKTIALCMMGTTILPAKYIMKTDDDAFVRIDEVLTSLKEKPVNSLLYGLIAQDSTPHRDKDSKWYISEKEWPHSTYPPWAHGPGYIISRDVAKFIVQGHQERELQLFKLEDVAMGIWVEQYKKSGRKVNYISDERFHNAGCESNYILAHYQSPRLVLCLWEMLQKEQKPICCE